MRNHIACRWLLIAAASIFGTAAFAQNAVRISEFHYDNAGTDAGEAVEISAPAGTDLTGWQVLLYNGNGGAFYDTRTLAGTVPATCGTRGVVVLDYPANGIQNGSPDGIALIDPDQNPVEFISYEGVFLATNGAAGGTMPVDIGVFEAGTEPPGQSLARQVDDSWSGPAASTFGTCNDGGEQPSVPEAASVSLSPPSATITVGNSVTLTAAVFDAANLPIANPALTWSSNHPEIATVSSTGIVAALNPGDAVVFATAANGVFGSAAVHVDQTPPATGDFHINEIHYDNVGTDVGEAIEIEGPAGTSFSGLSLVLYNGNGGVPYNTQILSGTLPVSCATRGVLVVNYPQDGIQNGSPDGVALVDSAGQLIEFISYEGAFAATSGPANGHTSIDIFASQTNAALGTSLQRDSSGHWAAGASSFGACNPDAPPPPASTLLITGRTPSDPPLPVGYEDQLFAQERNSGATVPTTITWASETPAIAAIEPNGVMHAFAEGVAILRATATDGTTETISLPTHIAVASGVTYPGNAEFGEPADADPSDDFIVRHEQYTASYNPNRGTPNWVSYDLDAAHFGAEDRCDCFTMDPDLPASFTHLSTADYTDAGAFHGYGIDRGHMTRSFDRTTGSLDNARTYLLSNVVPQAADLNQGPWANLENDLGDLARVQGREVYIVTGVAGSKGTLKNQGKIVIPASTWKVAVIMPHDHGLADIVDYRDLEVIAVNMPNEPGVRNVDWNTYRTTVDAIEALTGYDLLALLPDDVEAAVESGTQPPLAAISGPAGAIAEGSSATLDAAASLDPNGTVVSYEWDFGDGSIGSGVSVTHTYVQDGTFTVRLKVTDNDGLTGTKIFVVHVSNVTPVVGALAGATLNVGATHTASGTFTDPGADAWTATVSWGDGSAPESVGLSGRAFSLTHIYTAAGTYTAIINIADDDASATTTQTVTVLQPSPGLAAALPLIDKLIATHKISRAVGVILKTEVIAAQVLIGRGNTPAAKQLLRFTVAEIDALVHCRVVRAADLAPLRSLLVQVTASL